MLLYNNNKDNRNKHSAYICDAWFQLPETGSGYNLSLAYISRTLAVFVF